MEPGKEICVSLNPLSPGEKISDFFKRVKRYFQKKIDQDILELTHSNSAVDITPRGVNKGNALDFFIEKTSLDPKNILGVGDSRGDFPLLKRVGIPCCPSNAEEEVKKLVKKRGGYIASLPEARGVLEILKKFI